LNFGEFFKFGTPGAYFKNAWPGIGIYLGWVLTIVSLGTLAVEWWLVRKKNFRWILWTTCLTIVISQWSGMQVSVMDMVAYNLPFLLLFAVWDERWKKSKWIIAYQ
jgi:hypothetical protein